MSSQLWFMPGAFLRNQRLLHLLEVGLNILLDFREDLDSPERADDLLQDKRRTAEFSGANTEEMRKLKNRLKQKMGALLVLLLTYMTESWWAMYL